MPGGRLSQQDRQQIATGLAEGLAYTEIAKRLARPTSTITREVTRNGGPNGYRADQAHRATERRARRRRASPSAPSPAEADAYGRDPEAVHGFEEQFTELLVQTGLPKMVARVLGCLYATDTGSRTAADLVQRLQVSPASISLAVRYLEEQELVRRERDPSNRREHYVIDDDVWFRAMLASAAANAVLAKGAHAGALTLGADTPAGARLADMGRFLDHVGRDLVTSAEHWRQFFAARPAPNQRPVLPDTGA
ncbi:helix-turn-helix domain-containing protein [Solihabitans fulvus]|uniref:Helix-turn-helix domain-containing protein n=1 Tax=Solihabitans fulvus TaxID=1892852 RepID=A0A5B2XE05_9PSEU|nr:helix-turn-helix domain-containing protein [Solihabitans fulvus]KAA2261978.1 helix-turn-helix domain-containing protein [Solihabitans fulvus]